MRETGRQQLQHQLFNKCEGLETLLVPTPDGSEGLAPRARAPWVRLCVL
jgi:hypothetical protein